MDAVMDALATISGHCASPFCVGRDDICTFNFSCYFLSKLHVFILLSDVLLIYCNAAFSLLCNIKSLHA